MPASPNRSTITSPLVSESYQMLAQAFRHSLEARLLSPRTITAYMSAVNILGAFLATGDRLPQDPAKIRREHIEALLIHLQARGTNLQAKGNKPNTVSDRYRGLQPFFDWAVEEGYITANPMAKMKPPLVPEEEVDIPTDEEIKRLLSTCEGKEKRTFLDRRDAAIIRLFLDTGMRRSEMAGLKLADLDRDHHEVTVFGKFRKHRTLNLSPKTVQALDRYQLVRKKHHDHLLGALWLGYGGSGHKSAMTHDGIAQVVVRRAREVGLDMNAHQLRHKFADTWLRNGGSESDLMKIMGWTDPSMLRRYASALAAARAREAHQRLAIGDLF